MMDLAVSICGRSVSPFFRDIGSTIYFRQASVLCESFVRDKIQNKKLVPQIRKSVDVHLLEVSSTMNAANILGCGLFKSNNGVHGR
jgi:hypothetical protein